MENITVLNIVSLFFLVGYIYLSQKKYGRPLGKKS